MDLTSPELMAAALLGLLIGPFVQEDLAVIGAASLSVMHPALTPLILPVIMLGLWLSDVWKYVPGKIARDKGKVLDPSVRPRAAAVVTGLNAHPGKTLMSVRFVPFARIAVYVAAGYAGLAFWRFGLWVAISGALYIGIIFALFHTLGAVLAEQAKAYLPLAGFALAALLIGIAYLSGRAKPSE